MNTNQTLSSFIDTNKIRMSADWADSNPHMIDAMPGGSHYRCTLRLGRKRLTVYFSMGAAHTSEPTASDVLDCLASDASSYKNANGFEDWAGEYGYDTDSRKAEKTYRIVERQAAKLEAFLGSELFNALLWNTERM